MHLKQLHTMLLFIVCAALTACTDDMSIPSDPHNGKTPIALSVGGTDAPSLTRAVITDGTGKEMKAFDRKAKVFILIQSDLEIDNDRHVVTHDGYEFKGDRPHTLSTVSRGDVTAGNTNVDFDDVNKKYWDDAHARSSQLTMWAIAQKVAASADEAWKTITFQKIHGEDPMTSENTRDPYNTIYRNEFQSEKKVYPVIYTWSVGNMPDAHQNQDANTLIYQDLLFSNNIANYVGNTKVPVASQTDNRLKFDFSTHKFPTGDACAMKFYHAMSKITIKIKAGEGYKIDGTDFNLGNNTCIDKLSGFNTKGLFNIKDGEFQLIHNHEDITKIPCTVNGHTSNDPYYTLEALTIPNINDFLQNQTTPTNDIYSRFTSDGSNIMMEFTIDNSTFKITSKQLYEALHGKEGATEKTTGIIPLEAGKNYIFTFTIGMSGIKNMTAQVADWEEVTANTQNENNAHIKLLLEERGTAQSSDVAFYKAEDNKTTEGIDFDYATYNWKTGYANMGATYSTDHWTTSLYWKSNKDFYHFRALMPASTGVTTDGSGDGDYVTLASASNYTDVRWGAPFKDDGDNETSGNFQWTYNLTTGFDNSEHTQIYKAIGATEDPVKLILFHMMSDVTFNITTTTGAEKVNLGDGSSNKTKIELVDYKTGGKLLLGNGLVTATGSATTAEIAQKSFTAENAEPATAAKAVFTYGAIPQLLTNVKLRITTPDNNQYIVNLKNAKATTISTTNLANPYTESGGEYTINRWYPGFKYNYTFTLKKTGITDITATIVDWENVNADNENVQIK